MRLASHFSNYGTTRAVASRLLRATTLAFIAALSLYAAQIAQAQTEQVLYRFAGQPDGEDPNGSLVFDAKGDLYGTTFAGGSSGQGTAFRLTQAGAETVLYSFTGGTDGVGPAAGLVRLNGKLYGTAATGGTDAIGTIFALTATGHESTITSFSTADGGGYPEARLIRDKDGNLYGTNSGFFGTHGEGAVFKVTKTGAVSMVHKFTGPPDGAFPCGSLVQDAGNLYGTTYGGGASDQGTVFRIAPDGTETVLYNFTGVADGARPCGDLIRDSQGNLYGTTTGGGRPAYGTVFKLTPTGQETVLHNFKGRDGAYPVGGLLRDTQGNLYGMTTLGGRRDKGVAFKLSASNKMTLLHTFRGGKDGANPVGGLVMDKQGNLYGATDAGGNSNCSGGCGVIFKLIP